MDRKQTLADFSVLLFTIRESPGVVHLKRDPVLSLLEAMQDLIISTERSVAEAREREAKLRETLPSDLHSFCPECGPNVMVDGDALCAGCGATCTGGGVDGLRAALAPEPTPKDDCACGEPAVDI